MDVNRLRRPNQKAEEVTIFGERRPFLSGPMRVALRCGAPALQVFIVPEKDFRYRLDVVKMLIDPEVVGDEDAAVATAMADYADNVETHLRATPSLITRT
jgi:lauroyl/myristoyl acyltransferase